ncbi:MAG: Mur ligase domain-containing protein, partial [Kiritimatiellia bacterium]
KGHVHVSGVGGVGMNAVAQLLIHEGYRVTGSDRFLDQGVQVPVLKTLERLGVELVPQDGSALSPSTEALVLSTAVEADNPERIRAAELGIPERHRAEMLAEFSRSGPLIAVAGTSGKTSCTGWIGWTLEFCGQDPNVVNGGGILGWKQAGSPGNVRWSGPNRPWVVEVDESDRSLLKFDPEIALINTISADHHSLEDTVQLFRDFARKVKKSIVCGPGVKVFLEGVEGITAELLEVQDPFPVDLPGDHNAWNAAAVLKVAGVWGCLQETAERGVKSFRGIERRLELCSPEGRGPRVFDDYAHNPEKIAAAIRAVRPPDGKLTVLWRPHGFAPLQQNFEAFCRTFQKNLRAGDRLWILPVFYAGGTAPQGLNSADLVARLQKEGCGARLLEAYPEEWNGGEADVLLVMGARDPQLPVFAARMGKQVRSKGRT